MEGYLKNKPVQQKDNDVKTDPEIGEIMKEINEVSDENLVTGKRESDSASLVSLTFTKRNSIEQELISTLEDYVKFLDEESKPFVQMGYVHGMKVSEEVAYRGLEFRNKITDLKELLNRIEGVERSVATKPNSSTKMAQ